MSAHIEPPRVFPDLTPDDLEAFTRSTPPRSPPASIDYKTVVVPKKTPTIIRMSPLDLGPNWRYEICEGHGTGKPTTEFYVFGYVSIRAVVDVQTEKEPPSSSPSSSSAGAASSVTAAVGSKKQTVTITESSFNHTLESTSKTSFVADGDVLRAHCARIKAATRGCTDVRLTVTYAVPKGSAPWETLSTEPLYVYGCSAQDSAPVPQLIYVIFVDPCAPNDEFAFAACAPWDAAKKRYHLSRDDLLVQFRSSFGPSRACRIVRMYTREALLYATEAFVLMKVTCPSSGITRTLDMFLPFKSPGTPHSDGMAVKGVPWTLCTAVRSYVARFIHPEEFPSTTKLDNTLNMSVLQFQLRGYACSSVKSDDNVLEGGRADYDPLGTLEFVVREHGAHHPVLIRLREWPFSMRYRCTSAIDLSGFCHVLKGLAPPEIKSDKLVLASQVAIDSMQWVAPPLPEIEPEGGRSCIMRTIPIRSKFTYPPLPAHRSVKFSSPSPDNAVPSLISLSKLYPTTSPSSPSSILYTSKP